MSRHVSVDHLNERARRINAAPGDPLAAPTQEDIRNLELTVIRSTDAIIRAIRETRR